MSTLHSSSTNSVRHTGPLSVSSRRTRSASNLYPALSSLADDSPLVDVSPGSESLYDQPAENFDGGNKSGKIRQRLMRAFKKAVGTLPPERNEAGAIPKFLKDLSHQEEKRRREQALTDTGEKLYTLDKRGNKTLLTKGDLDHIVPVDDAPAATRDGKHIYADFFGKRHRVARSQLNDLFSDRMFRAKQIWLLRDEWKGHASRLRADKRGESSDGSVRSEKTLAKHGLKKAYIRDSREGVANSTKLIEAMLNKARIDLKEKDLKRDLKDSEQAERYLNLAYKKEKYKQDAEKAKMIRRMGRRDRAQERERLRSARNRENPDKDAIEKSAKHVMQDIAGLTKELAIRVGEVATNSARRIRSSASLAATKTGNVLAFAKRGTKELVGSASRTIKRGAKNVVVRFKRKFNLMPEDQKILTKACSDLHKMIRRVGDKRTTFEDEVRDKRTVLSVLKAVSVLVPMLQIKELEDLSKKPGKSLEELAQLVDASKLFELWELWHQPLDLTVEKLEDLSGGDLERFFRSLHAILEAGVKHVEACEKKLYVSAEQSSPLERAPLAERYKGPEASSVSDSGYIGYNSGSELSSSPSRRSSVSSGGNYLSARSGPLALPEPPSRRTASSRRSSVSSGGGSYLSARSGPLALPEPPSRRTASSRRSFISDAESYWRDNQELALQTTNRSRSGSSR